MAKSSVKRYLTIRQCMTENGPAERAQRLPLEYHPVAIKDGTMKEDNPYLMGTLGKRRNSCEIAAMHGGKVNVAYRRSMSDGVWIRQSYCRKYTQRKKCNEQYPKFVDRTEEFMEVNHRDTTVFNHRSHQIASFTKKTHRNSDESKCDFLI